MNLNLRQAAIRLGIVGLLINTLGANLVVGDNKKFSEIMLVENVTPVLVSVDGDTKVISQSEYNDIIDTNRRVDRFQEITEESVKEAQKAVKELQSAKVGWLVGSVLLPVSVQRIGEDAFRVDHGNGVIRYVYLYDDGNMDWGDGIDRPYSVDALGNLTFEIDGEEVKYLNIMNVR